MFIKRRFVNSKILSDREQNFAISAIQDFLDNKNLKKETSLSCRYGGNISTVAGWHSAIGKFIREDEKCLEKFYQFYSQQQ